MTMNAAATAPHSTDTTHAVRFRLSVLMTLIISVWRTLPVHGLVRLGVVCVTC